MQDKTDIARARCPFFLSSGKENVSCEGVTDDSGLLLIFGTEQSRNRYRRKFCNANYEKCEIYKAIMKKYEKVR